MKIPPSPRLPRRAFLRGSALAGAAAAFPAVVRAAAPNSSVQVAVIGVSGRGYSNLHSAASHPALRYVGFCDVDRASYARADADHPDVINLHPALSCANNASAFEHRPGLIAVLRNCLFEP